MEAQIFNFALVFGLCTLVLFAYTGVRFLPVGHREYLRWCWFWLGFTAIAFIIPSFWLSIGLIAVLCLFWLPRDIPHRVTYYFFLLPALPILGYQIPGFGGIQALFFLTYPRLLVFFVLLAPLVRRQRLARRPVPLFSHGTDKYVLLLIVLLLLLDFRAGSITTFLRNGFYLSLDIAVPYYVISRYVQSYEDFLRAAFAIVVSATVLSAIGVVEAVSFEHLYGALTDFYGSGSGLVAIRAGFLRTVTTFATPVSFGYFLTIALAMLVLVRTSFRPKFIVIPIAGAMSLSLFFTVSRGPWLGLATFCLVYALMSPNRIKRLSSGFLWVSAMVLTFLAVPQGEYLISLLPFTGGEYDATVEGRKDLFSNALLVIERNLWFGSTDYLQAPELRAVAEGSGFIDIVNTYVRITLEAGVVGLGIFISVFASVALGIFKAVRRSHSLDRDLNRLGIVLFSVIISILVMIGTTGSSGHVVIYNWAFLGLGVAYSCLVRNVVAERRRASLDMQARDRGPVSPSKDVHGPHVT